jgi:predicted nuclease with RNAse H fold
MHSVFVGIDVQKKRPCAVAAIDADGCPVEQNWFRTPEDIVNFLKHDIVRNPINTQIAAVGIDAPRQGLLSPREWYWDGKRRDWRGRGPKDKGSGRHCEAVLKAAGLANPQWTPLVSAAQAWMQLGFRLFRDMSSHWPVHEVFPTASYAQVAKAGAVITVDLKVFATGPKDMLDAYVSAWTVREYTAKRGASVGGGDGLGAIVLPCPLLSPSPKLLVWPGR